MAKQEKLSFTKAELLDNFWGCVTEKIHTFGDQDFLVTKTSGITFKEVDNASNVICQNIKETCSTAKIGVGLYLQEPRRLVECMLATLKANDYFVVLDVDYPEPTINSMVEDAKIQIILTETRYIDQIRTITRDQVLLLNLDTIDFSVEIPAYSINYSLDDIVQIMYTSGSSGKPKGAVEDYRYLIRAVYVKAKFGGFKQTDRLVQLSSFAYSGQHTGVFAGLFIGYSIYFHDVKEEGFTSLPGWIHKNNLTSFQSTVTTFRSFMGTLKPGTQFPSVHYFHIGGEKRKSHDVSLIKKHFPNVKQIILGYAGTEMFQVSLSPVPIDIAATYEILPCGKPIEDIRVFIWNEKGKPLPVGSEGEVIVYGDGLARGYINNPELNRLKFIKDEKNPGWQYFRTGDRGKILEDGQLMVLGRMDNMVKIKGVRIDIETIENRISSYPGIVHVASKVFYNNNGIERLATYYTVEDGAQVPVSDLRNRLAESLPIQQLPSYFICLDEIPTSVSGKTDYTKLPLPSMVRPSLGYPYIAPETQTEKKLISIWEDQIGVTGIGVTDDFFDVGGDSLMGVVVFVAIEEEFGRSFPVSTILTAPSVRELALIIDGKKKSGTESLCISLNTTGHKTPLFFIPGKGGYPTRIKHLVKNLDPEIPVYAFQHPILNQNIKFTDKVKFIAEKFIYEIRNLYKESPLILVGESVGGKIAYEIAQQIKRRSGSLPTVFLLDTYNHESSVPNAYRNSRSWNYYKTLLNKHALILTKANWEGKKEYLKFYNETLSKKISGFIAHRVLNQDNADDLSYKIKIPQFKPGVEITNGYMAEPYPGKVVLIMAQRGAAHTTKIAHGWEEVGIKDLVIEHLDCYHGSMLFEPAVSELAKIIHKHIQ